MSHDDDHRHARSGRALGWALVANAVLAVVQLVGGWVSGSLALLTDAAHQASDVLGLAIAAVAHRLRGRPASAHHTFGLQRSEVLGAQASAVLLAGAGVWAIIEAVRRLDDPPSVDGGLVIALALLGLVVNGVSALALSRTGDRTLNVRAAVSHLVADAAGSAGVLVAGIAVVTADADWVDAAVAIAIGAAVCWAAVGLLRQSARILLEGTPVGLDMGDVEAALLAHPSVVAVHHLHVWSLASDVRAASAHVVVEGASTLHEAQLVGDALKVDLRQRFEIDHATLELECHPCE